MRASALTANVFAQLHCLNLIRKFTYEDYYRKRDPMPFAFRDSPATLRKHVGKLPTYPYYLFAARMS